MKNMNSKSYQSFDGKIRFLKQHLQLLDVSLTRANKVCSRNKGNGKMIADTLSSDIGTHPQLNIPNKKLDIMRTFATSRKKVNEQAIIELYAYFSDYLSSIIRELENSRPQQILTMIPSDAEVSLKYSDIFKLASYDEILDEISQRVYRTLENERSTPKLLRKFIKTLSLNIPVNLQEDALTYLEVRHLIIHANSRADNKFHLLNKRGIVKVHPSNHILAINYAMSSSAIIKVQELCKKIDEEIVVKGLL